MRSIAVVVSLAMFSSLAVAQPDPGHSQHGEAFDEGPRQFAKLILGTGEIEFQVENCSQAAKQFINQAIGQLHGFLNYEAERSFRHAAYLDDKCVMAFWGIAMANAVWIQDTERATKIVEQARSRLTSANSRRERLYIEAIEALVDEGSGTIVFATKLREIWQQHPDDIDAKAFFVEVVWQNNLYDVMEMPGNTYYEKNLHIFRLAQEILAVNPRHPVHHYIVHMWDNIEHFSLALHSADNVGFAGPGIAHMWHMAGHIYNHAQLPFEMWWSQEAAARVDHAYMQDMRVFPFMLHNHAHNNEWLSRTLMSLGNFGKALRISTNMLGQPRHPEYNRADQYQHLRNGAARTLEVIERGQYWQLGATLFKSPFLDCEEFVADPPTYQSCLRVGKLTELFTGEGLGIASNLSAEFRQELDLVSQLIHSVEQDAAYAQLQRLEHLKADWGLFSLVNYGLFANRADLAAPLASTLVAQNEKSVPFLLLASAANAQAGKIDEAKAFFAKAAELSQEIDHSAPFIEKTVETLRAAGLSIPDDWSRPFLGWRDVHRDRPQHDKLGPLLWQVPHINSFQWIDKFGDRHDFEAETQGKPALIVLLLNECPLCDAQYALLDAQRDRLDELGVALVSVTSQPENMAVYRQMQAYDDFESMPIHGLYIINADREIVWQDLSADPFMDIDFLLAELERALHPLQQPLIQGRFEDL